MGSMSGGGGGGQPQQDWTAANISVDVSRDIWETYKADYTQWENDLIAASTDTSADMAESDAFAMTDVDESFRKAGNEFSMVNARMGVQINGRDQSILDRQSNLDAALAKANAINTGRHDVDERALQLMTGGVKAKNSVA